jgi:hypothetical protein
MLTLEAIYTICTVVGCGYLLLSLIFGDTFDLFGFNIDFELGAIGFLPKPMGILVGIGIFGLFGHLATHFLSLLLTLIPATIAGVAAGASVNKLVYSKLARLEALAPKSTDAIGTVAEVLDPIPPGGLGTVKYVIKGITLTQPARCSDPKARLPTGRKVYISSLVDNVYQVEEDLDIDNLN